MYRKLSLIAIVAILALVTAVPAFARGGGPLPQPVVFVESQGLYYDSIVTADPLPFEGSFQELIVDENDGSLSTQYGPGDPGYLGGRWWMDSNRNGEQDPDDHYFMCPLLGPGRETK